MAKRVADLLVDVLLGAGVQRIYGVSGDSLNGITDSIRTQDEMEWIHVRHEEAAAFAAGAEAHLTGKLAVCAGSCGPGNLHLINGLYDCQRSRVPVLAIAAQIPSAELGSGYFQETHPEQLFAQCSHYCELVSQPEQMPRVLEIAIQTAISRRGVAVIAMPGDVALRDAVEQVGRLQFSEPNPSVCPSDYEISLLADVLNRSKKITILAGAGCAGAHEELIDPCKQNKGSHRTRDAWKGVHRIRQPIRCGHDRSARILFWLSRDDELRPAADDWHGLPVSAVLPQGRHHCADRSSR